jgi:hypothetical protein
MINITNNHPVVDLDEPLPEKAASASASHEQSKVRHDKCFCGEHKWFPTWRGSQRVSSN